LKKRKKIGDLLKNIHLSFNDIGEKVGLTRERIRQVAKSFYNVTGKERYELRAPFRFDLPPIIQRIKDRAEQNGLLFDPIYLLIRRGKYISRQGFRSAACKINGFTCAVAAVRYEHSGTGDSPPYFRLSSISAATDFCVIDSSEGFLIVPINESWMRKAKVYIDERRPSVKIELPSDHLYKKNIEAWHLLKVKRRNRGNKI